jgi:arginyl-tRNA synthetase
MLPAVVDDFRTRGIATLSDGAWCIFFDEQGLPKTPFIIQKSDGAFNYATTDLATVKHRVEQFKADGCVYVVGAPQADHFKMLFAAVRKWGFTATDLKHVEFGSVLGEDGKLLRTRGSDTARLQDLLDEAEERALTLVKQLRPELPEDEQKHIATAVGIGAVKYADLMQNRSTDYKFSLSKMVALEGNTAPYLMMQYVRARSIFRKAGVLEDALRMQGGSYALVHPAELALAKHLLRFPDAIRLASSEYRPSFIASYLYDLAEKVSAFYRDCRVLDAEGPTRHSRLMLCDHFARTLQCGLGLLGIQTVEKM